MSTHAARPRPDPSFPAAAWDGWLSLQQANLAALWNASRVMRDGAHALWERRQPWPAAMTAAMRSGDPAEGARVQLEFAEEMLARGMTLSRDVLAITLMSVGEMLDIFYRRAEKIPGEIEALLRAGR